MSAERITPRQQTSGSETRRLTAWLPRVRCTAADRAQVEEAANRAGVSLAGYVLAAVLKAPQPRSVKVPPIERQALAQVLAQLGRLNGNINQIAKVLNTGGFAGGMEITEAAAEVVALRDEIRAALGRAKRDN
jgi:hypothetical protein